MNFATSKITTVIAVFSLLFVIGTGRVSSTTIIPPSFDELVAHADEIFEGSVTKVWSEWIGHGDQRRIVTYVTFQIHDAIKGTPGAFYTLTMLGGTVGADS